MKVFIVDDDEMLTMALTDYLEKHTAHEYHVFHTGEDCLKHLSENPDCVILDFYLNTKNAEAADGLEILKIMRDRVKNLRVIMLSSQESYAKAAQIIQKGAEQYVVKDEDSYEKIANMLK
jgi:DNA-binding NarL/FixJ family response regulator